MLHSIKTIMYRYIETLIYSMYIRFLRQNMKSIQIYVEDAEYEKLKEKKQDMSWHDFLMSLVEE